MSSPGDDDPPGGSPPMPLAKETSGTIDVPTESSIVVEPSLASSETSPGVPAATSGTTTGSIGRPFGSSTSSDRDSDSILPAKLDDDALDDAVGTSRSKKRREKKPEPLPELDDDGEPVGKNRKTMIVIGAALVAGVGISALVLLGRVNTERYFLECTANAAIAKQGRSFPPWGSKPMAGAEWRPIALPSNAHCKSEELGDRATLEGKFLDLLLERASSALTVKNLIENIPGDAKNTQLDAVAGQLDQALLLSRAPERGDQRKQVERMLGDVQYWRASLRLRDANAALVDAARQFDAAALQRPMHVSDAGAWAELVRRVSDQLHAGPGGASAAFPAAPTGDVREPAPQGAALPVEPSPAAGSDAAPMPPDAGVPTGGVLL